MIVLKDNQVYSDQGKMVHRLGSDAYFSRATTLPADTAEDFEEVDELPAFTKTEYDAKVAELVRERYSDSEEFAIQRKYLNALGGNEDSVAVAEFETYNAFVEDCKVKAKDPALYVNS